MYILFPSDPSTQFLKNVLTGLDAHKVDYKVLEYPDESIHSANIADVISRLPFGKLVVFLGHGTTHYLYGDSKNGIAREPIVGLGSLNIFCNNPTIFFSCFSAQLLASSRSERSLQDSLGFGVLPTEVSELKSTGRLKNIDISDDDLDRFKHILVRLFVETLYFFDKISNNLEDVFHNLKLRMNIEINNLILSEGNSRLAELLYFVRNEVRCE